VFKAGRPGASKSDIDRRVQLRLERQRVFERRESASLWSIIDEAALRDRTADRAVMKEQIAALVASNERPDVRLQLLSRRTPQPTSFAVLRFPEPELPDVAYIELAAAALYLDREPDVSIFTSSWGRQRSMPNRLMPPGPVSPQYTGSSDQAAESARRARSRWPAAISATAQIRRR
jgi:hypothetical protein